MIFVLARFLFVFSVYSTVHIFNPPTPLYIYLVPARYTTFIMSLSGHWTPHLIGSNGGKYKYIAIIEKMAYVCTCALYSHYRAQDIQGLECVYKSQCIHKRSASRFAPFKGANCSRLSLLFSLLHMTNDREMPLHVGGDTTPFTVVYNPITSV